MPSSEPSVASGPPLDREELREHYGRALDEYRFQVELNWKRSQYFFVLNLGVLVAATGLLSASQPRAELVAALFAVGAILAGVAAYANHIQHGYYRRTREVKRALEERLELGDLALQSTPGMVDRDAGRSPVRVRHALTGFLTALGLADLLGLALVICWYG